MGAYFRTFIRDWPEIRYKQRAIAQRKKRMLEQGLSLKKIKQILIAQFDVL